jgi:transposase
MAYMRKVKNREGREYAYLVEGYRVGDKVRSRTLRNFGSIDELEEKEPGAFERLKREAKDGKLVEKISLELEVSFDLTKPIGYEDKKYGWKLLDEVFEGLELSDFLRTNKKSNSKIDLAKALKLLTFQRILEPGSKLNTIKSQEGLFGNWVIDENTIYRSLDELFELKETLQLQVHNQIVKKIGRIATLVFYDVTNYYFETDIDDTDQLDEQGNVVEEGLRRRGPSKEHRPKPIVQLGLFMDTNGIPISYKLFRGNQTDPITYLPAIEQVKKQFGIERIVVVADKAMNSKNNLSETLEKGDGWLFSQKHRGKRGAPKEVQNFLLNPEGWVFNETLTFAKKSMIRERKLNGKVVVQEKVLVTWNKKYADREKIRRDGALEYASKLTNAELFIQTAKKGGKKYLELSILDKETGEKKPFAPFIQLNQEEADFDAQFDGMNVLVTSEIHMTDEEMMAQYKELSRIEDCFRVTKTEFHSRPVFVWTKEHIEAHFLTCFLALVLIRIIQHACGWALSPARIVNALNSAKASKLIKGYYKVQANTDLIELHDKLGIKWDKEVVKVEDLNKYANGWFTTLKR